MGREDIAVVTLNPALTATGFFQAQANPEQLPDPDMGTAAPAEDVAREVLSLDRRPRPERSLRWKWRLLGILSILAPGALTGCSSSAWEAAGRRR